MGYPKVKNAMNEEITLEQVNEFFEFLKGNAEYNTYSKSPKTSPNKAFGVIYFLQERMNLIPDRFEMCCCCKNLFDTDSEGTYIERTGRHYCDNCRRD